MTAPPADQGGMGEEEVELRKWFSAKPRSCSDEGLTCCPDCHCRCDMDRHELLATIDSLRARARALEAVCRDANAMILSLQHAKDTSSGNDSGTWFPSAECPVCGSEDIKPHRKDCKLIAVSTALDAALSELDGGK